jgi:hypothetical protein
MMKEFRLSAIKPSVQKGPSIAKELEKNTRWQMMAAAVQAETRRRLRLEQPNNRDNDKQCLV